MLTYKTNADENITSLTAEVTSAVFVRIPTGNHPEVKT